ncbi:MAG: hypothetical protein P4L79_11045 [Legionella sp.]|uniref:hypothetical protein n=1 Tax=Legionella sp. TaxID=459 RepID=UPI002847B022|nr:hypothetical protein [Legionella sp.]
MKTAVGYAYTFTPGSNTLQLSSIPGFNINKLMGVFDSTTNTILYAPSMTGFGYSAFNSGTSTLTLQASMTGCASGDNLCIIYDDSVGTIGAVTGAGTAVEVIPTVTASTYVINTVVGGIITFANALPISTFNGILHSITLKFKGSVQAGSFAVALFTASPTGTYTDHGAPTFGATDNPLLLGIYKLTTPLSSLGTHTVFNLDNINKQIVGTSTSLFAVVVATTAITTALATTGDMSLQLGIIK